MPQKRNPVSLEHTRILASKAFAQAQGVLSCAHNTPFGDIVDSEDDLQPLVFSMFADAGRALQLFTGVVENCTVQEQRLREAANDNFLSVTELADTLVREEKLSFRAAHQLVSRAVKAVGSEYNREKMVNEILGAAPQSIGRDLTISREQLIRALDPDHFVDVRKIVGGPSVSAVTEQIRLASETITEDGSWLQQKYGLLQAYPGKIRAAESSYVSE